MVGLSPSTSASARRQADINIFTVASGLLYEVRMECPYAVGYAADWKSVEIRVDHDLERHEEHPKLGQILVHRTSLRLLAE